MNESSKYSDHALLVLRLAVGGLMLLHGIHKIQNGIGPIENMLAGKDLPRGLAMGVYAGEVVAPILILLGFLTRPAAFLLAGTMLVSVWLAYGANAFQLTNQGGLAVELNLLYLAGAVVLSISGGGRFSVGRGEGKWS